MNTVLPLLAPFAGLRPRPGRAAEVVAPPYDVLDSEEARARAQGKPWSFLHISKAEIDFAPGTDPYVPEVYAQAAESMRRMVAEGVLVRDPRPCFYVYRLTWGEHVQTGIVGAASVLAYDDNRVRKHEFTRPAKEDDRVRQIEAVNAQTGPVLLAHPPLPEVAAVMAEVTAGPPAEDVIADDGVGHALWVVDDDARLARLVAAFDSLPAIYIADGHHRSAAASRVAAMLRENDPEPTGSKTYDRFLIVTFPADQMKILDYNRVVRDLGGLDAAAFLHRLEAAFTVEPVAGRARPRQRREVGLFLEGRWYRLTFRGEPPLGTPAAETLDVALLARHVMAPLLGITDPRRDSRIDFVGGVRGLEELERRVDTGEWAAAFALFPTSMDELMAVAEAGEVMPPKSTWFEPKLADGLVSYPLG